ncbi:MAG: acylneuraminate cytidylyltransferase family protein [Bacteroidota bacterium]
MKHHSERVPGKNIRPLNDKPLLFWILQTLQKSKYINGIIVNTDSEEIASEVKKYGKVEIHMRPEYLLNITSNEAAQIIEYDLSITEGDYFLQTHATNPLLTTETIDNSIKIFFSQLIHDSLFSVTPLKKRLYWEDGKPINHDPSRLIKTQLLPVVYEENSCIYIFSKTSFSKTKNRLGANPMMFSMNPMESVDIDEEEDFILAEFLLKEKLGKQK